MRRDLNRTEEALGIMNLNSGAVEREAPAGELEHELNDVFGLGFEPCRWRA